MNRRASASLRHNWHHCFNWRNASWSSIKEVGWGNYFWVILWFNSRTWIVFFFVFFCISLLEFFWEGAAKLFSLFLYALFTQWIIKWAMLAIRLWWLGMDILSGEEVRCCLHPQGQSDSAGQQWGWLFSAIVIYSSTQPEPAETHYWYNHVLCCGPLGSCRRTHFGQWQIHRKAHLHTTYYTQHCM